MPIDAAEVIPDAAEQPAWATAAAAPTGVFPDLDITLGPPLVAVAEGGGVLLAASDDFLHVLVSAQRSADGAAADPTAYPVQLAVVRVSPAPADWLPGDWLVRTAAPAGAYARLAAGPDGAAHFLPGSYWVYVRIAVGAESIVRRAPTMLIVA